MGGFAGGLLSGIQGVQSFAQQRRDNQYRRDALALDRSQLDQRVREHEDRVAQWGEQNKQGQESLGIERGKLAVDERNVAVNEGTLKLAEAAEKRAQITFDKTQAVADGNTVLAGLQNKGFLDIQTADVDAGRFAAALDEGVDTGAPLLALQALNASNVGGPQGFDFTSVERLDDGRYVFSGTYEDGRRGVLTATGGVSDAEEVAGLTGTDVAKLVRDNFYQLMPNTSLGTDGFIEYMTKLGASRAAVNDTVANAVATSTVLNAADSLGVEFSRGFRGVLAKAGSENERREMLRDFASTNLNLQLDLPDAAPATEIIGSIAEPAVPVVAPAALGGVSYYDPSAAETRGAAQRAVTRLDSQIADLESQAEQASSPDRKEFIMGRITELDAQRQELVQRTNTQSLEATTARIKDLTTRRDKAAPARREYWQEQIDAATQEKIELERGMGVVTPAMETEAYKKLETEVFARIGGMSEQEIQKLVDSGAVRFTPEQTAVLRQRADELGGTIADIKAKSAPSEQAAYYALLSSMADTQGAKEQLNTAWMNVTESGTPSISAKDAAGLRQRAQEGATARDRLNFEIQRAMAADFAELETLRPAINKAVNDVLFVEEEDGTRVPREGMQAPLQFARETFPLLLARIGDAKRLQGVDAAGEEKVRVFKEEAARGLSIAMNRIADAQGGDVWERIKRFFGGTANEDYTLTGLDFDLDRIKFGAVNSKGEPQSFVYASGGGVPGNRIPASLIRQLGPEIYNAMYAAAERNQDQ